MKNLDVYLWTEGFGANLVTSILNPEEREGFVKLKETIKVNGIILGDPFISTKFQYSNFGSFAEARFIAKEQNLRTIYTEETKLKLKKVNSQVLCDFHQLIYRSIQPLCPFNILSKCREVSNNDGCNIFPLYPEEITLSTAFNSFINKKLGYTTYLGNSDAFFKSFTFEARDGRKEVNYSTKLVEVINKYPTLILQSQNNMMMNPVISMIYIDYLKWKDTAKYIPAPSKPIVKGKTKLERFSLKKYGNLWKVQLFGVGSQMIDDNGDFIWKNIFKSFTNNYDK